MSFEALLFQALNGLAAASSLFFVGAGLSLIFGVTRIINIAHGSFYMLGLYLAATIALKVGGVLGFWGGIIAAGVVVAALGGLIEILLLRRIYQAPELFQLLATFALVLVINDVAQYIWGPEDLLGPRAPGLRGSVEILGRNFPSYDLFLIAVSPVVLLLLHLMLAKTRFGRLIRAATQDREMVGALGVNQAMLFTVVFVLGSFLAGFGGALQVAREPANLWLDLIVIGDAFVVVVVGGMGSISGAFLAAVIIAEVKALCIGLGVVNFGGFVLNFSKLTLVAEFLVMAIVLIVRPYGLLGRPQAAVRNPAETDDPIRPASRSLKVVAALVLVGLLLLPFANKASPYALVLGIDVLDRDPVRDLAAFHHGSRRHALVRPCRLFRARRLWRSPDGEVPRGADTGRPDRGAGRGAHGRAAVRLVRGAAVRGLPGDADIGFRADRLVDPVPVGGCHRRLQRHSRHLAASAVRQPAGAST